MDLNEGAEETVVTLEDDQHKSKVEIVAAGSHT